MRIQNIYNIELLIFEADGCVAHKQGEIFKYPQDIGEMCPWLLDSANSMIRVLRYGGILPWRYEGTPYEKKIDPDSVTTEFIRCPDPTAKVVLKVTRHKIGEIGPDGLPRYFDQ
jgi:uncharacterized repeat protein (TIGR04076 family)